MSDKLNHQNMQELSIDDLMEVTVEEVEKTRDFVNYPKGIYLFEVKRPKLEPIERMVEGKKIKDKEIQIHLIPQEIVELNPASDADLAAQLLESKQPLVFKYRTGYGIQDLLTRWEDIMRTIGTPALGAFLEEVGGTFITAEIGIRRSKNKDTGETSEFNKLIKASVSE